MTDKEKITAEVERLKNDLTEAPNQSDIDLGRISAFEDILLYIDSLKEEPISDDLEEAAKKSGQSHFPDEYNIWARPNYEAKHAELAFKEGANWMKNQLMKETVSGRIDSVSNNSRRLHITAQAANPLTLKTLDRCKVIIIKEIEK